MWTLQHCAIPVLYASSWLLTAFAADFPLFFSSRVMDVVLTDRYLEPMMKARRAHAWGRRTQAGADIVKLSLVEQGKHAGSTPSRIGRAM